MKPNTTPVLNLEITKETYQKACQSNSGDCLIAEAIKRSYPHLSHIEVDSATVRATDRERGERYIYLTPYGIREFLLCFDQGWEEKELPRKFQIRRAVRIMPIEQSESMRKRIAEKKTLRLSKLEEKEKSGGALTSDETRSLARLRNPRPAPERIKRAAPSEAIVGSEGEIIIRGRERRVSNPKNPNLLAGHNRHFGARTARPTKVFEKALKQAVKTKTKKLRERIKTLESQ